jgi:hypothetical protein
MRAWRVLAALAVLLVGGCYPYWETPGPVQPTASCEWVPGGLQPFYGWRQGYWRCA